MLIGREYLKSDSRGISRLRLFFLLVLTLSSCCLFSQDIYVDNLGYSQRLTGTWEFVWGQLLTPSTFYRSRNVELVDVPGNWRNYNHSGLGIGTYRVKVHLQEKKTNYSILFPIFNSSAKVWINGAKMGEIGVCEVDKKKYKAQYGDLWISVPRDTLQLEVVVQVANFSYSSGGIVRAPELGETSFLSHKSSSNKGIENFFSGSLAAMFIYQIVFFFLNRRSKPHLYLSLICFIVALRALITHGGSFLLLDLFPNISMGFWKRLEFFSVYSVACIFPLYVYHLFPLRPFKRILLGFVISSASLCVITIVPGSQIYYKALDTYHIILIGGLIYAITLIATALKRGYADANVILIGVLTSLPFVLMEIAQNSRLIGFGTSFSYLAEIGVLVFLAFQVYLISNHYAKAYKELETANADLDEKVRLRTTELTKSNKVREKLLSIVSHDIRGPINSLRGVLNVCQYDGVSATEMKIVLKKIEENMRTTSLLMDNVLVWASNQLKGVKVTYSKINLKSLVEEHFMLFASSAHTKKVSLINSVDLSEVQSDREILSLVLRNIIANAIKFSFEEGKIVVRSLLESSGFSIEIRDEGAGMPDEILQSLFKSQVISSEGTFHEKGTGLGLSLCYDYIKCLDGEIYVKTELNKGTSFRISLPFAPVEVSLQ